MQARSAHRWARLICPLGLLVSSGCGRQPAAPDQAAPRVVLFEPALLQVPARPLAVARADQPTPISLAAAEGDDDSVSDATEPGSSAAIADGEQSGASPMPPEPSTLDLWDFLRDHQPVVQSRQVDRPATSSGTVLVPIEIEVVSEQPSPDVSYPAEEQAVLPWGKIRQRSPEMGAVVKRSHELVSRAVRLASQGAVYSARNQLIEALRTIAQAYDAQSETNHYSLALAAGLTALKESQDFAPSAQSAERPTDVAAIVAGHRTVVLKQSPGLSALSAQVRYYTFAQEQLASAAGGEVVGSAALYQLGKVLVVTGAQADSNPLEINAHAMALYQAALLCDGRNYRAAHDLGLLLAYYGRPAQARDLLLRAANTGNHPATWQSLAVIYERLGDRAASARARERLASVSRQRRSVVPGVQVVDPSTMAQLRSPTDNVDRAAPKMPAAQATTGRTASGQEQPAPKSWLQRR